MAIDQAVAEILSQLPLELRPYNCLFEMTVGGLQIDDPDNPFGKKVLTLMRLAVTDQTGLKVMWFSEEQIQQLHDGTGTMLETIRQKNSGLVVGTADMMNQAGQAIKAQQQLKNGHPHVNGG